MRTRIFYLVSVIFLLFAISCKKAENTTVINGVVVDSLTSKPIKGVLIQLYEEEVLNNFATPVSGYNVATDTTGVFVLKFDIGNFNNGMASYYIRATKDGYVYISKEHFYLVDLFKEQNILIKMKKAH